MDWNTLDWVNERCVGIQSKSGQHSQEKVFDDVLTNVMILATRC